MAMTNAERQRKYKEKVEATGLTRLQAWVTPEQAQAVKRFMTGEDGLAVRGSVISNDPPIIDPPNDPPTIDPPNDPPIDRAVLASLQTVMERWEEKLKHHQDTTARLNSRVGLSALSYGRNLHRHLNNQISSIIKSSKYGGEEKKVDAW